MFCLSMEEIIINSLVVSMMVKVRLKGLGKALKQDYVCVFVQVRQQMEEQVAQKSTELEQYLQRVRELEDMYHQLEEALEDERQAKQDEEAMHKLQAR